MGLLNIFKRTANKTELDSNLKLSNLDKMTPEQFSAFSGYYNLGTNAVLKGQGVMFQTQAYDLCPPLQAVVSKKAQAITKGKLICVDNEENIIKSKIFDDAIKIINKPNAYQTKNQFIRFTESLINVYGVCYWYKVKPIGLDKITGLIIIPNNCITVCYNKPSDILSNQARLVRYYQITIFGKTFMLSGDDTDLIHEIQDSTENLTQGQEFYPKSRIDALRKPIENIIGSLESRNHLIVRRGADVMLSPNPGTNTAGLASELDVLDKKELQADYATYGLLNDQLHTFISKMPMNASKIGMNVRELGLFDGELADHRAIAGGFGVPIPLLALPDTTKFNTYLEAKTEFYEDTILPESEIISQAFDSIFNAYENGFKFYFDYSHLACMQKSNKDTATAFKTMVDGCIAAEAAGMMSKDTATTTINDFIK